MDTPTVDPALPVLEHDGRTLDWRPRFDARSMDHRIGAGVTALPTTGRVWAPGPVLDQGAEGACVGFGCADEAAAEPVPVPGLTNARALAWYRRAQRRDQWPGENYSGTSVLAGLLEGRARKLYAGFRWAKSAEELAAGIVADEQHGGGPGIIGVEWRQGAYSTDRLGVLRPSGSIVGGHCLCVLGFLPARVADGSALQGQLQKLGLWAGYLSVGGPAFVILNSWGPSFGINGLALVPLEVMQGWVRAGGEFAIPQGRALPAKPRKAAAESPESAPATAGGPDETHHLAARAVLVRDRIVDGVPDQLGQETVTVLTLRLVAGWDGQRVRVGSSAGAFTLRASDVVTVRRPVSVEP